jgi:hypothetical protein
MMPLVAPQGFVGIANKEDTRIICDRTPICTHKKNNIHTPISCALRRTLSAHLGHCGKGIVGRSASIAEYNEFLEVQRYAVTRLAVG